MFLDDTTQINGLSSLLDLRIGLTTMYIFVEYFTLSDEALNVPKHALYTLRLLRLFQNTLALEVVESVSNALTHFLSFVSVFL